VEPEIHQQLARAKPGVADYRPSASAKADLQAAAKALKPLVTKLRAAGVRTKKFEQAVESLEGFASGRGSHSTDYAIEDMYQSLAYGVEALR
jgi:hypothetical protein